MSRTFEVLAAASSTLVLPIVPALVHNIPPKQIPASHDIAIRVVPAGFGLFSGGSDAFLTLNASFTPNGETVYFSKSLPGWSNLSIFLSHKNATGWSTPEMAPFSGVYRDTDPAVSPDGSFLIFASNRPPKGKLPFTYALYKLELRGPSEGRISPLPNSINNGTSSLYPSIAKDNTLYFIRVLGKSTRILRSKLVDGEYQSPEPLHFPDDEDTVFDSDPTIAPDQSFIVFVSNRPDSLGGTDVYLSFRNHESWCRPQHLPSPVNSSQTEIATGLSLDGRTLYFASSRSSVDLPRAAAVGTAGFRAEAERYANGTLRTFKVDIGFLLDSLKQSGGCQKAE